MASLSALLLGIASVGWFVPLGALPPDLSTCPSPLSEPQLAWNTFLGGAGVDYANDVTVDGDGQIYICGMSNIAWGAPVLPFADGNWNALIAKLDAQGNLLWHTFLGAPSAAAETCVGVKVISNGTVIVLGSGNEDWGIPVRPFTGANDAFVAGLASNGTLLWSTFLGGSGDDFGEDVALDASGNIYVVGRGESSWGAPLRPHGGGVFDGFVAKLDPNGNLLWNTFVGGAAEDHGVALAVPPDGNVYVTGFTASSWGAPVEPFSGGARDAFVASVASSGGLLWHTFLGGSGADEGRAIAISPDSGLYVAGPSTAPWGVPRHPSGGGEDGFVAKLDSTGRFQWNTFLGGAAQDIVDDVANDGFGGTYVSGFSRASWGASPRPFAGGLSDAFAARVDAEGQVSWNLFLGSPGGPSPDDDYGNSMVTTPSNEVYVFGDSDATWGTPVRPYTTNSHDTFLASISDATTCDWGPTRNYTIACSSAGGGPGAFGLLALLFVRAMTARAIRRRP